MGRRGSVRDDQRPREYQILVYHRANNGNLNPTTPIQTIATGGGGSGLQLSAVDSLGSAGSVQLDEVHRLLFAVNAESAQENNGVGPYNQDCQQGTISSFRVASDGTLTLADRVFSGGLFPNSLTVKRVGQGNNGAETGDLLYVLNAGGPGSCGTGPNITGFRVTPVGHMIPVGSEQAIDPGPASGSGVNCPPLGLIQRRISSAA
jgi:6-phosphogluconolactonase